MCVGKFLLTQIQNCIWRVVLVLVIFVFVYSWREYRVKQFWCCCFWAMLFLCFVALRANIFTSVKDTRYLNGSLYSTSSHFAKRIKPTSHPELLLSNQTLLKQRKEHTFCSLLSLLDVLLTQMSFFAAMRWRQVLLKSYPDAAWRSESQLNSIRVSSCRCWPPWDSWRGSLMFVHLVRGVSTPII